MDHEGLAELLRDQDGVVARRQLRDLNLTPHEIRRLLRRRELVVVHPGVYVNHTGELSWQQRAQAAVQAHWPAALASGSALPKPQEDGNIHVAIDVRRTVVAVRGVTAHRTPHFDERVLWLKSPPRIRIEHAVLDVAAAATDELAAFRVIADAAQTRQTTPAMILAALAERPRIARASLLRELLTDLEAGACSVLERAYLNDVERRHGLPCGVRQQRASVKRKSIYRDVHYVEFTTVVELDGSAFHNNARSRDADFERDLATAAESADCTLRLTYGQVFGTPCTTASRVAAVLRRRGWSGELTRCPDCPAES